MKISALFVVPASAYSRRLMRVFSSLVRTSAILSGVALFLPLFAYGQVSFFMTPTYPASENVVVADFNVVTGGAIAVADFNLDGRPDILAGVGFQSSLNNSNGVAVLLNTTPPGTKADFQLSASALSPRTITAGGSATSTATVMPLNGFLGTVNLACTISPAVSPAPTCTVKPTSVQLTGNNAPTAQVTVATTAPVTTGTISYANSQPNATVFIWMMLLLTVGFLLVRRRRKVAVAIPAMVLALASGVGCGGGAVVVLHRPTQRRERRRELTPPP